MPYRILIREPTEDLFTRLIDLGALDVDYVDDAAAALMPDSVDANQVTHALGVTDVVVSPAIGRDAGSVWILNAPRVRIGTLEIAPADSDAAPHRVRLLDDLAFGSGLHPTTSICLRTLQDIMETETPQSMLDVGTGSGVLALAALTLGVPRALAIDTDRTALRVAAKNADINGMSDRLALQLGGPESVDGVWPLVFANILAAVLIDVAAPLTRRVAHEGRLVLSGIASGVQDDVLRAYRDLGMRPVLSQSRGDWTLLMLRPTW